MIEGKYVIMLLLPAGLKGYAGFSIKFVSNLVNILSLNDDILKLKFQGENQSIINLFHKVTLYTCSERNY
jgi:hypothetical protein